MMNIYNKDELKKILKKDFNWLASYGFYLYRPDTYVKVCNNILHGIYFQKSENKRAVCITLFIQPLFIQFSTIMLNFGFRMDLLNKNTEEWIELDNTGVNEISNYIKQYGITFFESHNSADEIVDYENIKKYKLIWEQNAWSNIYCFAFCFAALNKIELCKEKIKEFRDKYSDYKVHWMEARLGEINELEKSLDENKQNQLIENICCQMKKKLKLK